MQTIKKIINSIDVRELNQIATYCFHETKLNNEDYNYNNICDDITVTKEYRMIRDLLSNGCPVVFVTGKAGTGKTTLISYIKNVIDKRIVVLAPTGVAALNAGGVTIHSFFHFPPRILEEKDIKIVNNKTIYEKLELLIIDEISMVRSDLIDNIDMFLRKNRKSEIPFGGVQLLLVGDLFQLPPVIHRKEWDVLRQKGYSSPYFFSALSLQKTSLVPVELTLNYRQKDRLFIELLNKVRIGRDLDTVINCLNKSCYNRKERQGDIILTCTNKRAEEINKNKLNKLPFKEYLIKGEIEGDFSLEYNKLPSPFELRLKKGACVMFTKNDEQKQWVNGTIGIVREIFEDEIIVELVSDNIGMIHGVFPVTWEKFKYSYEPETDQIIAHKIGQYTQYPLMLAWGITIHKSQGKTLDKVLIDLDNGAFAPGQVYVALSRCRCIEGINLVKPIRKEDVKVDPIITRFYQTLAKIGKI